MRKVEVHRIDYFNKYVIINISSFVKLPRRQSGRAAVVGVCANRVWVHHFVLVDQSGREEIYGRR